MMPWPGRDRDRPAVRGTLPSSASTRASWGSVWAASPGSSRHSGAPKRLDRRRYDARLPADRGGERLRQVQVEDGAHVGEGTVEPQVERGLARDARSGPRRARRPRGRGSRSPQGPDASRCSPTPCVGVITTSSVRPARSCCRPGARSAGGRRGGRRPGRRAVGRRRAAARSRASCVPWHESTRPAVPRPDDRVGESDRQASAGDAPCAAMAASRSAPSAAPSSEASVETGSAKDVRLELKDPGVGRAPAHHHDPVDRPAGRTHALGVAREDRAAGLQEAWTTSAGGVPPPSAARTDASPGAVPPPGWAATHASQERVEAVRGSPHPPPRAGAPAGTRE